MPVLQISTITFILFCGNGVIITISFDVELRAGIIHVCIEYSQINGEVRVTQTKKVRLKVKRSYAE